MENAGELVDHLSPQRLHNFVESHVLRDVDHPPVQVNHNHVQEVGYVVLVDGVDPDDEGGGGGEKV